ncbi:Protein of unknown function (DUF2418) [Teratosphaeria destructans]|uniref:Meiotically up-regulated gene 154 protein n=1 Tax=Teratosphaeria destructans TaxID=418781 RepID=A0A9W7SPE0_9PEZI|nr:Protein of unknown function (DUF2418) [Teratosphaeria destructans]
MPRLVRRRPVTDRLKELLDPWDTLLWLSEILNDDTYDEWLQFYSIPIGISLNIIFVIARGISANGRPGQSDDVFGDSANERSGWFAWFATLLVQALAMGSMANAVWVFVRTRKYRLFEVPVEEEVASTNASRVRVDSSPLGAASPLRYVRDLMQKATSAEARAFPDAEREVWELRLWDPKPAALTVFTLFSPGHVLVYYAMLPPPALDPRPSVTVVKAFGFAALLSLQTILLQKSFGQQAKDSRLIQGEVMNEYNNKFVHPSLNRPVRDVGVQTRESAVTPKGTRTREVDVYTPTTIVNRGFRVSPNPYVAQEPSTMKRSSYANIQTMTTTNGDTNYVSNTDRRQSTNFSSRPSTGVSTGTSVADFSSPLKPHHEKLRERSPMKGDGGSLGVYGHAASPLRKTASSSQLRNGRASEMSGRGYGESVRGSPLKRMSMPGGGPS